MSFCKTGYYFYMPVTGIYRHDDRWYCTGFDTEIYQQPQGYHLLRSPEEAKDTFIQELLEVTEHYVYPRIVFRTSQDLTDFLNLQDPRLNSLQQHVTRMCQTKNMLVCTATDIMAVTGRSIDLSTAGWFTNLMDDVITRVEQLEFPPLQFLDSHQFAVLSVREYEATDSQNIDFNLTRFLLTSDRIITAIINRPKDGIRCKAGEPVLNKFTNAAHADITMVLFVPDDHARHPYMMIDLEAHSSSKVPGIAIPVYDTRNIKTLPPTATTSVPRDLPFDLIAATQDAS